ncbi:hypothetical protein N7470_010401 [Penicillium chermesinum]|nr:hypothetical protein N7470_010401 [Penicillium chermesinum]
MKTTALIATALALPARALPNAPDGYAPQNVSCPSTRPSIRSASTLSDNEEKWLPVRRNKTLDAMKDFFGHVSVGGYDVAGYLDKHASNASSLPNVAVAVSGGGYRAMLNGAGAIKAFDSRISNSTTKGHLGGLLQSATYVAGLSGGSWLLGSIWVNNFTTISDLQTTSDGDLWQLSSSIFSGPDKGGLHIFDTVDYYKNLVDEVDDKKDAGYETAVTDLWGRALGYQFFNGTDGGVDYTWSSIADMSDFKQGNQPLPLVVADGRNPGEKVVGGNATIYEFNPWEFGTWDPTIYGFAPLEYLGSPFEDGKLPSNGSCVRGFDNAGFIIGTSSTLFNQFLLQLNTTSIPSAVQDLVRKFLTKLSRADDDIAPYDPNPFYRYNEDTSPYAAQTTLELVDGGEDGQNIPLQPVIQPNRHIDVVFAIDSSADTDMNWPNGTSLVATYERSLNATGIGNHTAFPAVPDTNTFVNEGLNTRPTFFGCNSSNTTSMTPLIVYIPNYPYSYLSNTSTFMMEYTDEQRDSLITNGYEVATMGNGTRDGNWTACVGCAMLQRSFERTGTKLPDICDTCFSKYCWDGKINSTTPAKYEPKALDPVKEDAAVNAIVPAMLATMVATVVGFSLV